MFGLRDLIKLNERAAIRALQRPKPLTKADRDVLTTIARRNNYCPANPFNKPNYRQ